jgi:hypothetical protein
MMNRDTAEKLMAIYARVGTLLNEATDAIESEADEQLRKRLRAPIGVAMAHLWTDLQLPLVSAFPELNPDKS